MTDFLKPSFSSRASNRNFRDNYPFEDKFEKALAAEKGEAVKPVELCSYGGHPDNPSKCCLPKGHAGEHRRYPGR
jgi:hypothetical protein